MLFITSTPKTPSCLSSFVAFVSVLAIATSFQKLLHISSLNMTHFRNIFTTFGLRLVRNTLHNSINKFLFCLQLTISRDFSTTVNICLPGYIAVILNLSSFYAVVYVLYKSSSASSLFQFH